MAGSLREKLRQGHGCLNGWSLLPGGFAIELLARGGWDSVTLDMQHGLHDYASVVNGIQALQAFPVTPLVRVPWNEPGILGKVLDGGAQGVICPMVNTAADAVTLTRACLYPPFGMRSNGPVRGATYGGPEPYQQVANRDVLLLPQIETGEAVDNIDSILEVRGVGGIYIGPSDLGLSLGLPASFDREEPQILDIYARLIAATRRRGLLAAIHNHSAFYAARMLSMGFGLVTVGSDSGLLAKGAREIVESTRAAAGLPTEAH